MSQASDKVVAELLEPAETYATGTIHTRSKGKVAVVDPVKTAAAKPTVKEVDQYLTKFTAEFYEMQRQSSQ